MVSRPVDALENGARKRYASRKEKPNAKTRPRHTLVLAAAAVAALALCALAPRAAHAQAKGKIYVSDVEFGSYASDKEMAAAIKRQSKTTIKEEGGTWPLNFMIFLNAAPGADKINIVYYDLSKKNEQVDFAEVGVKPDQKIIQLNGQARVEGEGLRQRAPVRHPRDPSRRRQGEGLRQGHDHAEVIAPARHALIAFALALPLVAAGGACRSRDQQREPLAPYRNPDLPAIERAADVVRRMTVSEKIAQTMTAAPAIPRLGVPAYEWWSEALHGVARAGRATVFPQAIALAATFDEPLMRRVAGVISDEARAKFNQAQARGQHGRYQGLTFFSPNVNIFRDPRWGRGHETFGGDPVLTTRMGVAFISGMQGDHPALFKTVATAKHFAVHSGPEADRHTFDARVSAHDLADTYLPHFEAIVRSGRVASVMAAYNQVNGEACVASPTLLRDTLRGRWGFLGYVVGDCDAIDDVWKHHELVSTPAEAAAAALRAGTDLDCGRTYRHLDEALARGLVTETELDRALVRLFTARFRLGLFDPPGRVPWSGLGPALIEAPAHLALAREAAARSIVLLENRNNTLPLAPSVRRLAVVGPMADDLPVLLANYHGIPSHPVRLLDGVRAAARARGITVGYAAGSRLVETSPRAIAAAVAAARDSDAVIAFVGLDPRLEGEERGTRFNPGGDRLDLDIPAAQRQLVEALFATGKPVIAVLTRR